MTKSILRYFITVLIITLLSSGLLSTMLISNSLLNTMKQDMLYSLKLIDYAIDYEQPLEEQIAQLNPLAYSDETRISIIDSQGNVLADTSKESISENHLNRQEVHEAIAHGVGYAKRQSETTGEKLLYVAYYVNDVILRLSIPYNGLADHLSALIPALTLSTVISFIIAYLLSRKLAYRISKPIIEISDSLNHMTKDYRFELKQYEFQEFNSIVDTIHNLSHRLRKSIKEVNVEREKIEEILKQMNEGFVLLDETYRVLSINEKAISILGKIEVNEPLLRVLYYPEIIRALENDINEQQVEIKADHTIYACYISRIDLGTTLLFVDITAAKKAEKMRSEFFSNVSHELKTPMTSIRGYSDLLVQGLIQDEKQQKQMLEKIQNEVSNMSTLINDILALSRLENKDLKIEMLPLKIKNIIHEVIESYEVELQKHDIQMILDLEELEYVGNPQQMVTLFNNLIGNAIKFNRDHGQVKVSIHSQGDAINITVKDTGIGIPLADQPRVFERFYRVDKGRSRQRGGTGLGLAIVKHIVSSYQGVIHLTSQINQGTTIEIILPQQEKTC